MPSDTQSVNNEASSQGGPTLQDVITALPRFGERNAVGLRLDLGLRWWSYVQLHRQAMRAAAVLAQAGVGKGDCLVFRAKTSPEWVAFLLGAWWRGAAAAPVDHDSSDEFAERVADEVGATRCVVNRATGAIPGLAPIYLEALDEPDREETASPAVQVGVDDPAIVFYTSGTTSQPRGVRITHGNIMSQVARFRPFRLLAKWIPARIVVVAPLSHTQGVMMGVWVPLSLGMSVIQTQSSHPAHLLRVLRDNRVLFLCTVPRSLSSLAAALRRRRYGLGGGTLADKLTGHHNWFLWRHHVFTATRYVIGYRLWVVLVGGAPLPREDERFWRHTGCLFVQGYGLTETTGAISINAPLFGAFGSVGHPLPHQDLKISADGEILVRGPNVMRHYQGKADESDADEGYLRTGDLGRLDSRNRLFLLGRKKDMIVTGEGFNVFSGDVEIALTQSPGVRDALVIGLDQEGHAETHAVLLLTPGASPEHCVRAANDRLLSHQKIRSWTVWPGPDFPRTSLQKIRRKEVQAAVENARGPVTSVEGGEYQSLGQILGVDHKSKRLALLADWLVSQAPSDAGAQQVLTGDLGLSSLDTVELLFQLEERLGALPAGLSVGDEVDLNELREQIREAPSPIAARRGRDRQAPRWAEWKLFNALRRPFRFPLLRSLLWSRARLRVSGLEHLAGVDGPLIFAGGGHEHGFDALLVYCALPARLRRRVALVTSRWVFTAYLDPTHPGFSRIQRAAVALGFHAILPLLFPFVLSSNDAAGRESLMEACRMLDRRTSLIAFEGPGMALAARQAGVAVVPVTLRGNEQITFVPKWSRERVEVQFEAPMHFPPGEPPDLAADRLENFYANVSSEDE